MALQAPQARPGSGCSRLLPRHGYAMMAVTAAGGAPYIRFRPDVAISRIPENMTDCAKIPASGARSDRLVLGIRNSFRSPSCYNTVPKKSLREELSDRASHASELNTVICYLLPSHEIQKRCRIQKAAQASSKATRLGRNDEGVWRIWRSSDTITAIP